MDPAIAAQRYAHGTYARYRLAACRCFECKVALANYVSELAAEKRKPWRVYHVYVTHSWVVRNNETREIRLRTVDRSLAYRTVDALNKRCAVDCDREFVGTAKALKHIKKLQASGVGYKTIAKRAMVSETTVFEIINGDSKRLRRETETAILSVDATVLAPSQLVPAAATYKILDELLARGYSKAELARRLGYPTGRMETLYNRRQFVKFLTAQRVRALHESIIRAVA